MDARPLAHEWRRTWAMMSAWTIERWLLIATLVVSVLGFTFGIGVNWARVTQQAARQDAFERTYVRMDVYAADQRLLSESINRLTRAIERMEDRADRDEALRAPAPPQRQFDR